MEYQDTLKGHVLHGLVAHSQTTPEGLMINVKVKPHASQFRLYQDGTLEVKSPPIDGKANMEIIKEFKKRLGCEVLILMGISTKKKVLLLKGMDHDTLNKAVRNWNGKDERREESNEHEGEAE
jgi:uncharacterized protein (TIGR00251 family)